MGGRGSIISTAVIAHSSEIGFHLLGASKGSCSVLVERKGKGDKILCKILTSEPRGSITSPCIYGVSFRIVFRVGSVCDSLFKGVHLYGWSGWVAETRLLRTLLCPTDIFQNTALTIGSWTNQRKQIALAFYLIFNLKLFLHYFCCNWALSFKGLCKESPIVSILPLKKPVVCTTVLPFRDDTGDLFNKGTCLFFSL